MMAYSRTSENSNPLRTHDRRDAKVESENYANDRSDSGDPATRSRPLRQASLIS